MNNPTIYFTQLDMNHYRAFVTVDGKRTIVAGISQLSGEVGERGTYRIVYTRQPGVRTDGAVSAFTTRTVIADLDVIQARITARGW